MLNQQFSHIPQSPTVAMNDRIVAYQAQGQAVIPLQVGDPDFATPPAIIARAHEAMQAGLTHYAASNGSPALRRAAAQKLERDNALHYDPHTEILMTHGGIHAYYLALQSILNPGDEVLLPDPTWATHANMVIMLRGTVKRIPAPAENGFLPHFSAWEKALSPKTRAIVLNYPSNPTGAFPSREYYEQLQAFAAAHHLWVISDEVYESLYYTAQRPPSAAQPQGAKERTLLVHSLSKTYAMTGWRVGYLAAPAPVLQNALKAGQNSITCLAPFTQQAAAFALTDPQVQDSVAHMRAAYARRRDLVLRLVMESQTPGIQVSPPMGAFYFFLDFRALGIPSLEICERLLQEAGVGLVPGSAFGAQGEGFVRMTIAASEETIETGLRQILGWTAQQKGRK